MNEETRERRWYRAGLEECGCGEIWYIGAVNKPLALCCDRVVHVGAHDLSEEARDVERCAFEAEVVVEEIGRAHV